jgi:uncharacterized protein
MPDASSNGAAPAATCIRVAATADVHTRESRRRETEAAFAALGPEVDLVLIGGDLTTYGLPEEAAVLADACRAVTVPVVAVLGNHDWHSGRVEELRATLEAGGVKLLDRGWTIEGVRGVEVGIVGVKGFIGGFPSSHLSDFGEPLLREAYAETGADVEALDAGLRAISHCPLRIALMHYSPVEETLRGEPPGIHTYLGSDRLAAPIVEHQPDLVVHGHAHAGSFEGCAGDVAVFNVSVEVTGRDFWQFELTPATRAAAPLH